MAGSWGPGGPRVIVARDGFPSTRAGPGPMLVENTSVMTTSYLPTDLPSRATALEQRVAELARAEAASRAFIEIGRELVGTLDVEQMAQRIVEIVVDFF